MVAMVARRLLWWPEVAMDHVGSCYGSVRLLRRPVCMKDAAHVSLYCMFVLGIMHGRMGRHGIPSPWDTRCLNLDWMFEEMNSRQDTLKGQMSIDYVSHGSTSVTCQAKMIFFVCFQDNHRSGLIKKCQLLVISRLD